MTRSKKRVIQEAEHYRSKGYAAGLDAAREAVEKWFAENRDEMTWPEFLATVDALKEKP